MKILKLYIILILLFIVNIGLKASDSTLTVTALDNPAPGYLVLDWMSPHNFFLVDNYGTKQYYDTVNHLPGITYKPLRNGLWVCSIGTKYMLYTQDMQPVDSIPFPEFYTIDPHEIEVLSNGHYLLLSQESIIIDLSEVINGGKKNAQIISNVLIETDRTGTIYWIWKAYDHIKITDVTSDINLTQQLIDYTHVNSFAEAQDGNILVSFRHLDEITKIKKDSTGQIIWRLGGSKCKNNQFTFINDSNNDDNGFTGFSHQHAMSLLPNGNILMFDNGNLKNYRYSRAVEYQIDVAHKIATKVWEYRYTPDIYQNIMGSAYRMSNGNTLINWCSSKITEVKQNKSKAFELTFNSNLIYWHNIYRAWRLVTKINAVAQNITETSDYTFDDQIYRTGVTISVNSLTGSGLTSIEKHNYAPPTCEYKDSNFSFIYPYRWVFSQNGISNISGIIKIKASTIALLQEPEKVAIYKRGKEASGIFEELNTVYDSSSGEIEANFTGFGEFTLGSKELGILVLISPTDNEINIPISGWMTWNDMPSATNYQLQLSASPDFDRPMIDYIIDSLSQFNYQKLSYDT
ncbi:MAG: aryl-sulfate sulfotransferase, partial [FCB group bacterium]